MKPSRKMINDFFEKKKIGIAGVSRDPKKFGSVVFKDLQDKGFNVFPVNPNMDTHLGAPCFKSVAALPAEVESLLITTPKSQTLAVLKEAVSRGFSNIWIQQMSESPEVMEFIKTHKLTLITKQCILMFAEPVRGFHKFHRTLKGIFGSLPK
jgi:predicted CoA-binding protein